jgi:serine protease Do
MLIVSRRLVLVLAVGIISLPTVVAPPVFAEETSLTALIEGEVPTSIADLRAMQQRIQATAATVLPTTVAVRVGSAHGSGVIISQDGYVLTAAHVAGEPNQPARLTLHDGRRVRGVTLGVYRTVDAGLLKITSSPDDEDDGEWPHAKLGNSREVVPGQWCLATGHPGGFQSGRPPVVRVGRILSVKPSSLNSDCTLIGGDSGGPLYDLSGNVIGVHSRIGGPLNVNLHVPVNTYRTEWQRLANGEAWGRLPGTTPYIGVQGEAEANDARIVQVYRGSPAEAAGVEGGDIIVGFADQPISDFASLKKLVDEHEPGTTVIVNVKRGDTLLQLELTIGDRRG